MSTERTFRVDEVARHVGGKLEGDGNVTLRGFASLADARPDELSFFANERYESELRTTRAGALITGKYLPELRIPQIVVADPFLSVNKLMDLFHPADGSAPPPGIDAMARVADSAELGPGVRIGPHVFVDEDVQIGARSVLYPGVFLGKGVRVGEDCMLWPNVVVREGTLIGSRVIVHPGAILGADGFGYARRQGRFIKIRHVGIVVVEDDVEIGANATVDRATLGRTVLRRGVKLDNLVHIGHNVDVGEDSIMAAQCGISGSTTIGNRVMMGGQVGLVDHLAVGDDAILIAQSGVIGNVPGGVTFSGYPARPHRDVLRAQAELRSLSRLKKKIRDLEKKLEELQSK